MEDEEDEEEGSEYEEVEDEEGEDDEEDEDCAVFLFFRWPPAWDVLLLSLLRLCRGVYP